MEAARRDATAFQRVITMWIETYCIRAIGKEEKAAGGGQESELKSEGIIQFNGNSFCAALSRYQRVMERCGV